MAMIRSLLDIPCNVSKHEFLIEQLLIPTFEVPKLEYACDLVGPNDLWYHEIYTYLRLGILPTDITPNLKQTFLKRSLRFVILGETLFCRSIDGTLLHCLKPEEASTALTEVHNGTCGSHLSGMTLAKKSLRTRYY